MLKYILGFLKNIFNTSVSILALVDNCSIIEKKAKINRGAKIFCSSVGAYSYVGCRTSLVHTKVGKFCSIAGNSSIGLGTHTLDNISTSPIFTEKYNGTGVIWTDKTMENPYKEIYIGNDVWIGAKVIIMGGIHIGDGAIVGAGSIVTKDVPPYAIVAGVPAKIIRFRFEKTIINKLLDIQWWNAKDDKLIKNIQFFQTNKISLELLDKLNKLL